MVTAWIATYWNSNIQKVEFDHEHAMYYVDSTGKSHSKRNDHEAICPTWQEARTRLKEAAEQEIHFLKGLMAVQHNIIEKAEAMQPPKEE